MSIGSLGVVGWAILGILPAVFWTFVNVRRAAPRRERQFVRRGSVLVWGVVAAYLAALRTMPEDFAGVVLLVCGALFLLVVALLEWRRSRLREQRFPGSYLFVRRAPFGR